MILKQAGEVAAKQPSFTYAFGISALNAGHFSESLQALQSAANSNYRYADSYYYLGQAYLVLADTSQACIAWDISLTGGHPKVDSLIQKWCTFGAHTTVKHP
jgi:tetratricopeptide (TPR) repeat protein